MKDMMKKVVLTLAMLLILVTSTTGMVFSIISFNKVNNVEASINNDENNKVNADEEEDEEEEDEDEVIVIGDVYEIIPTDVISDAYISGNKDDLSDEDKVTLEVASEILDDIIKEDMTDYEKEEAIYLWICDNIETDTEGTVAVPNARGIYDRPYGVLQNKQAVCVGYATTFKLLANMVGLECLVMHDTELTHTWNIVQLDDGCWYIVDCYNDAGEYGTKYANFNMNEEMASMGHDWDISEYPVANGTQYNYLEMSKVEVDNMTELIMCVSKFYNEGKEFGVVQVPVENNNAWEEVYYIIDGIYARVTTDSSDVYMDVYEGIEEETLLITYQYFNYEEDYDDGYGDDYTTDYEWLDTMLDDTFGTTNYWEDEDWEEEWEDEEWEDIEKVW